MQLVYDSVRSSSIPTPPARNKPSSFQRSQVWTYLQQAFPPDDPIKILEINCSTGEDALYMTRLGHRVLATDPSPQAIAIAKQKAAKSKFPEKPTFHQVGLGSIHGDRFVDKFDLIFSNFGGLNTLNKSSLLRLAGRLPRILKPEGRVIAVIMPKTCLWENAYSVFSQQHKPRRKEHSPSDKASVWYHDPKEVREIFDHWFDLNSLQPIGFALPPSNIEEELNGKRKIMKRLNRIEKKLSQFSFLSGVSDHYLVDFKLR